MKANILFIIGFALFLQSFSDPYTMKRISDKEFRYEFYTTDKKVKAKDNKIYYWFKGGLIHNAQAGFVGELLDDKFVKTYNSNQIAEQGTFRKGLKIGLWKTWYTNGIVATTQKWCNGLRSGTFYSYDEKGLLIEKGKFRKNEKHGIWIDCIKKDTIVYKKGLIFIKKIKEEKDNNNDKPNFFKRLFRKKSD